MIKALNDNVILRVTEPEKEKIRAGGIIEPNLSEKSEPYGVVLDLSTSAKEATGLEVGDKVILNSHQVLQQNVVEGEKLLFVSYKTLLGLFGNEG